MSGERFQRQDRGSFFGDMIYDRAVPVVQDAQSLQVSVPEAAHQITVPRAHHALTPCLHDPSLLCQEPAGSVHGPQASPSR